MEGFRFMWGMNLSDGGVDGADFQVDTNNSRSQTPPWERVLSSRLRLAQAYE